MVGSRRELQKERFSSKVGSFPDRMGGEKAFPSPLRLRPPERPLLRKGRRQIPNEAKATRYDPLVRRIAAVLAVIAWSTAAAASATLLEIRNVALVGSDTAPRAVRFEVSWKNGWSNSKNHDAAWLFVKLREDGDLEQNAVHARLAATGHSVAARKGSPPAKLEVSSDRAGAFLSGATAFRGDAAFQVELALDPKELPELEDNAKWTPSVFGIEMVFIPEGPFWVGDPDPAALDFSGLYRVGPDRAPAGPFEIASENPIRIGPEPGKVDYRAPHPEFQGDRLGPVPAGYPKGFAAFFLMKYEITQGQYADFLNTLGEHATALRAIHGGVGYEKSRGTITKNGERYTAGRRQRPANFVGWEDGVHSPTGRACGR